MGQAEPGPYLPLVRFPNAWRMRLLIDLRCASLWLAQRGRWMAIGVVLGLLPVALDCFTSWYASNWLFALGAWPLLLAAAASDRAHPGLSCLSLAIGIHAAAVISLAALLPERMAAVFPPGLEYWEETAHWIRTGETIRYDVGWWLPVHGQLALVMLAWGYLSLGLVPLVQGVFEIDLMNFYVGRLAASSSLPGLGLLLAWHPWSICRGVGFCFLTWELASLGLERLAQERLSTRIRRARRWLLAIGFLALDIALKWLLSGSVRSILAEQLGGGEMP